MQRQRSRHSLCECGRAAGEVGRKAGPDARLVGAEAGGALKRHDGRQLAPSAPAQAVSQGDVLMAASRQAPAASFRLQLARVKNHARGWWWAGSSNACLTLCSRPRTPPAGADPVSGWRASHAPSKRLPRCQAPAAVTRAPTRTAQSSPGHNTMPSSNSTAMSCTRIHSRQATARGTLRPRWRLANQESSTRQRASAAD